MNDLSLILEVLEGWSISEEEKDSLKNGESDLVLTFDRYGNVKILHIDG